MTDYPLTYDELKKIIINLYLKEYPKDKWEIILERLNGYLKDDVMKVLYESTCIGYNRSKDSIDCDDVSKRNHFKSLAVKKLQLDIGGIFDDSEDRDDLKRIEENFRILVKDFFLNEKCIGDYDYHFPKITEDLYIQEEFNRVPGMFGGFFYFLKLEDGKPVLYAEASSRMDLEELYIIDETCYRWIKDGIYYEEKSKTNIKRHWS